MKEFIKWLILFEVILSIKAYYINVDDSLRRGTGSLSLNEINISFEDEVNKFPKKFYVDVSSMTNSEYLKVSFVKYSEDNHPVASSDIYTSSGNTLEKRSNTNNFELYREENGNGYATLILNEESNNSLNKFRMIGSLHSKVNKSKIYDILPVKTSNTYGRNTVRNAHISREREFNATHFCNLEGLANQKVESKLRILNQNKKRAVNGQPINLYVEMVLVTDRTIYNDQQKFAQITDQNLTFQFMKIYFSHFFSGVNLHYANSLANDPDLRITIKLKNFIFFTTDSATDWTNSAKYGVPGTPTYNGKEVLQAPLVLDAFKNYMNAATLPFTFDMAVAAFNKDMWGGTTLDTQNTVGLAYLGRVCTETKYTIIEEIGGFSAILVTSHEIGHNLGAAHDGDNTPAYSSCPASNGNIMSPMGTVVSTYNQYINRFSSCSINAFKSTLLTSDLSTTTTIGQCLTNSPGTVNITDPTQLWNAEDECKALYGNNSTYCTYPGQIWSANDQCKMMNGNESYFCTNQVSSICTALWCGKNGGCIAPGGTYAAEGTTCDVGKICLSNQCVNSPVAPKGQCLFPDQQILQSEFNNFQLPSAIMECNAYVKFIYQTLKYNSSFNCFGSYTKTKCCTECLKYQDYNCFDSYSSCATAAQYCNDASITFSGVPVGDACPSTCGKCQAVKCKNSIYVCQNGGTCVDTTPEANSVIGFKCNCPLGYYGSLCEFKNGCLTNPCPKNSICKPIGSLGSYVCNGTNLQQTTTPQTKSTPTSTKTTTTTTRTTSTSKTTTTSTRTTTTTTRTTSTTRTTTTTTRTTTTTTKTTSTTRTTTKAPTTTTGCNCSCKL